MHNYFRIAPKEKAVAKKDNRRPCLGNIITLGNIIIKVMPTFLTSLGVGILGNVISDLICHLIYDKIDRKN